MSKYAESTRAYEEETRATLTLLTNPELAPILIKNLTRDSFSETGCRKIFICAEEAYEQYKQVTKDLIYSIISSKKWWEAIEGGGYDGREWIQQTIGIRKPLTSDEIPVVTDLLNDKRSRRIMYKVATRMEANALDTSKKLDASHIANIENFVKDALEEITPESESSNLVLFGESLEKFYTERAMDRVEKDFVGVGIDAIDTHLVEGLIPPGYSVLAGPTSSGKSLMIQTIALQLTMKNQQNS